MTDDDDLRIGARGTADTHHREQGDHARRRGPRARGSRLRGAPGLAILLAERRDRSDRTVSVTSRQWGPSYRVSAVSRTRSTGCVVPAEVSLSPRSGSVYSAAL